MKSNNFILSLVTGFLLFFSCSKDSEVISSFPFTIEETHTTDVVVNTPVKTTFKIVPEKTVESNPYFFKYEVLSGSGAFLDSEENPLTVHQFIPISGLSFNFNFVALETGDIKVKVTVKDSFDKVESIDLSFKAKDNPYVVTFTSENSNTSVNSPVRLSLLLNNSGGASNVTYQRMFRLLDGDGILHAKDSDVEIPFEAFKDIDPGLHEFDIRFSAVGTAKVEVTVKDSNGQTFSKSLSFDVSHIPFSVSFSADYTSTFVQKPTPVSLRIESSGPNASYTRMFSFPEGEGKVFIKNSNQEIPLEAYSPAILGLQNFEVRFASPGIAKLQVSVKDNNGNVISKTLDFDIQDIEVAFNAAIESQEIFADEPNKVFFSVSETNGSGGSYELKYVVNSGDVSLSFNNVPLLEDTYRDIILGNFFYDIVTNSDGDVSISFILSNKDGATIQKDVTYLANEHTFSFEANSQSLVAYTTQPLAFDISISEQPWASPPYSFRFFSDGQSVVRFNGQEYEPGQLIDINQDQFTIEYIGANIGVHNVSFFLENERALAASVQKQIAVSEPNFDFETEMTDPNFYWTNGWVIDRAYFDLSIIPYGNYQSFTFSYEVIAGSGKISSAVGLPNYLDPNVEYEIVEGSTSWFFSPSDLASNVPTLVRVTAVSNTGVVHQVDLDFIPVDPY